MSRSNILTFGLLALVLAFGSPSRAVAYLDPAAPTEHREPGEIDIPVAGEEHLSAAQPNILEFKPSLALATLIVFGLLLLVLWKFAWGPLSKALADRERSQEETLRAAEHARSESERLLTEHRAQMAQAAEQVRALLDQARRDAEATSADIVRKAQTEAESSRDRARREIETARDQALSEIWTQTADLAVTVAGKVLSRELGDSEQRRLVEVAMNELPTSPSNQNGHGGHA
jgi:F-type H+-transporting ATPase subunit b